MIHLRLINNRKGKGGPKVASPVELRVTYDRKVRYIATGISVTTSQWKDGEVVKCGDAFMYNKKLKELYVKVSKICAEMEEEGFIDLASITDRLKLAGSNTTFWQFVEDNAWEEVGICEATRERYFIFLKKLKDLNLFKTFSEINEKNIRKLDDELRKEGLKQSTIASYHKNMKKFIHKAVNLGFVRVNPYEHGNIKVDKGKSRIDRFLTLDEFDRLRTSPMPTESLSKVRDAFVFGCLTGLSYIDLCQFDSRLISEHEGMRLYMGNRGKNDEEFITVILDDAQEILDRYDGTIPMMSNQKYNQFLKLVALYSQINKPLSSHWARHTSAMLMLNYGVRIEIVSKVLGHAKIETTQKAYAKILGTSVARELRDYEKKIKG